MIADIVADPVTGRRGVIVPGASATVIVAELPNNKALVKANVPDGMARTPDTIVDVIHDGEGSQLDLEDAPLTNAQRTAVQNRLLTHWPGGNFTWVNATNAPNRKRLLRELLRRYGNRADLDTDDVRQLLFGYDAA